MITMLNKGYMKIMALFYKDKKAKIHLRHIARKAGLNENSTTRFLDGLVKENILAYEKDGNLKKYGINVSNATYLIFSIFDLEKFNNLPSIRKNSINYFFNSLKEKPIIMILFGSTSKENYEKDSDVDLLLIVNKKIDAEKAERYAESQTGISINCFQISYSEFLKEIKLKNDRVIASAINTGYPIMNHIKYYEEILS
jgi:predicted transcriptional regulator